MVEAGRLTRLARRVDNEVRLLLDQLPDVRQAPPRRQHVVLPGLADPGGICISGGVYDQGRDRVDAPFEDMGEQKVKNIDRPVRMWRWAPFGGPTRAAAPGDEK